MRVALLIAALACAGAATADLYRWVDAQGSLKPPAGPSAGTPATPAPGQRRPDT